MFDASEIEDNCVMEYLKQRNLVEHTTLNTLYYKRKNCDQTVRKVVQTIYEKNFDYLKGDARVDNNTYRTCLRNEFNRHKMEEKFLKARAINYEPQQTKLTTIRDAVLFNIKLFCSRRFEDAARSRFKEFVSDTGSLSPKMVNHPAVLKIKENSACLNRYAIERKLLDPSAYKLDTKLINQTEDDCKWAVYDVTDLIMDEWHIRRVSEDDKIQRCLIRIFLDTQAVDSFIKYSILSQLHLTQQQRDFERENFIKSSEIVHEMSYECMSIGFEKI